MALQDTAFYNNLDSRYLRFSFAEALIRYAPNGMCPLFGLTAQFSPAKALAVEHGYFAKTMVFPNVEINNGGGYNAAATTLTVVDTSTLVAGQLLRVQSTGEQIRVQTIASATSITVLRGIGAIAAASIPDASKLYSVGSAFEQASNAPSSRLINTTRIMNYTQIFRNTWALPGTVTATTPVVGGTLVAESKIDCGMFHGADIETAMIFGQRSAQQVNNQYLTTMDGVVETVRRYANTDNTNVAGATTNYDQLQTYLNPVFNTQANGRNGNRRLAFGGGKARTVINDIGRKSGTYMIVDGATNFGLQFQTFKTSRGEFKLIEHPMLNSNPDWSGMLLVVDPDNIRVPHLRMTSEMQFGMDGKYVQNGQDAVGGTLTTELTMEIINPSSAAIIHGLQAGVA